MTPEVYIINLYVENMKNIKRELQKEQARRRSAWYRIREALNHIFRPARDSTNKEIINVIDFLFSEYIRVGEIVKNHETIQGVQDGEN